MIFMTFRFAFLTATFFRGYFSFAFFITVFFLCFYVSILPPTGLLLVHHSIYINQKTVNTSICSDKGLAFETSNLQSLTRQHLHVVCMSPPTGKKNPWGPQKSLSVKHRKKVQECADPRISKRLTSCALYPRPNQWRLVTVEIVSINSIEKKKAFHPPTDVAPQFFQKITTF